VPYGKNDKCRKIVGVGKDYMCQKHDKAAAANKQDVTLILAYKSLFSSLLQSRSTTYVETWFVLITFLWFELS
jgi:hypothetical protein